MVQRSTAANPAESVVASAGTTPPSSLAEKATRAPTTGLPSASSALTRGATGTGSATSTRCPFPSTAIRRATGVASAVARNTTDSNPTTVARSSCGPGGPMVQRPGEASPSASVTALELGTEPPPPTTSKATTTPLSPAPDRPATRARTGSSVALPVRVSCRSPEWTTKVAGCSAVAAKTAVGPPATDATTDWEPTESPSVQEVRASPSGSVVAVAGATTPLPGAGAKVTSTPATALPPASRTRPTSGALRRVPGLPVCPSPAAG